MNQVFNKESGFIVGVAASALIAPSLSEASIKPSDLRPTPIVAAAQPGDFDLGQVALPPQGPPVQGGVQQPPAAPQAVNAPGLPNLGDVAPPKSPAPSTHTEAPSGQSVAGQQPQPPFIGPLPPPSVRQTDGGPESRTAQLTSDDLGAIREAVRDEMAKNAPAPQEDSGFGWKVLTVATAFMAAQGYWRWRYRTKDDFRKKASDLRGMLHDESLYFEDSKFVVAYDRAPKALGETRQLIVENPRTPRDLDTDLEMIIGPYCSEHLRRAALLCTPEDPFIMDHVEKVPISWAWIRDEFFRWEFGSAMRLWRAKQEGEQRFTADLIKLRLKTALESSLGEQAIDILEGRDRSPRHFLIAVLCDVQKNDTSPTGEMRRIVVRVIPDDQFGLYGDPSVVARMREFNRDTLAREIDLVAKLHAREHHDQTNTYANGAGLLPGHPRANRPTYDYSEAVRLILRPAEGTPADPAHIRAVYGNSGATHNQTPST